MSKTVDVPVFLLTVRNNKDGFTFQKHQYGYFGKTNEENIKLILESWKRMDIINYEVIDCKFDYTQTIVK
jgi:hypothetical protein